MENVRLGFLLKELSLVKEEDINSQTFFPGMMKKFNIVEFSTKDIYLIFFLKESRFMIDAIIADQIFSQKISSIQEAVAMIIHHGSETLHILLCDVIHPESNCPTFKIDGLISPQSRQLVRGLAKGYNSVAVLLPNLKKEVPAVDIFNNMGIALKEMTEYAGKQKIGFQILKISFPKDEVTLVTE